jgi:hypothetical protein
MRTGYIEHGVSEKLKPDPLVGMLPAAVSSLKVDGTDESNGGWRRTSGVHFGYKAR